MQSGLGPDLCLISPSNNDTICKLLAQWEGGAHGYVPDVKEDNTICLACENTNGLTLLHSRNPKIRKLVNLNNRYQTDGMCIVKHGVNFGHE